MSEPGIVFIGGTRRGHRVLEALLERGEPIRAVYALEQDAHEHDRFDDAMQELAAGHGVPCTVTRKIGPEAEREILEVHRPDLLLVIGWRTMIPMSVVDFPRLGSIGAHDSLLPRGRGFAPTNWAVINGDESGGVTLFHLAEDVDAGDMVDQREIPIGPRTTAPELYEGVTEATVEMILEHIDGLKDGTAPRIVQDHSKATFYCARRPEDGVIDWALPTAVSDRLIRGLAYPYPGARTSYDGRELTVWEAAPVEPPPVYEGRVPGRPVRIASDGVDVLTGDGVLRLTRVQLAGDPPTAANEVIRSVKATLGT